MLRCRRLRHRAREAEDFKGLTICGIQSNSELIVIEAWLLNNGLERGKDYQVIYSESMSVNIENVKKGTATWAS